MRKEYNTSKQLPAGLVFYAPMDAENGLKDIISGNIGTTNPHENVTYDPSYNGYLVEPDKKIFNILTLE